MEDALNDLSDNLERILENNLPGEYALDGPNDIRSILQDQAKGLIYMQLKIMLMK